MGEVLGSLQPKLLWEYFEEICKYPRPSKKEEKVVAYMKSWVEEHGFEYKEDAVGNMSVKVPATPGMENKKTVVIQGHLDMVPEKNRDSDHDFDNDPIQPYIDGEWVAAKGTTLGADNGIGVAAGMAVATDKDVAHGPLELLLTLDEETGMTGAGGLQNGFVDGRILLNLDSEEDGALYIGCSGGIDTRAQFAFSPEAAPSGMTALEVAVDGLKGGHSGLEIHIGKGNAIKLMGRLLLQLTDKFGIRVADIEGGSKRNAIPREAVAVILAAPDTVEDLKKHVAEYEATIQAELKTPEPDLKVLVKATDAPAKVMDAGAQKSLVMALHASPHGVQKMSADIPGLVETSTNLATIEFDQDKVLVGTSQRSSVESEKDDMASIVGTIFQLGGATVEYGDGYPGWAPNVDSEALKLVKKSYQELFGDEPEIKAIHAGLECGIIGEKMPGMDMISFGPTIQGAHSPDERISIPAVEKFWQLLLQTLKNIPEA